jgi:hypothetical protein
MSFRFRKSISICPGVRINLGKSGVSSVSVGPRGASLSLGQHGTYANFGIPGTGISYRARLDNANSTSQKHLSSTATNNALVQQIKAIQHEAASILNVHTDMPNIHNAISLDSLKSEYVSLACKPFRLAQPIRPEKPIIPTKPELKTSWFGRFFSSDSSLASKTQALDESIRRWEVQNTKDQINYLKQRSAWATEYAIWKKKKESFRLASIDSENKILQNFESDDTFFEEKLRAALAKTVWPRETTIDFEIDPQNALIKLAVDLPEIEDIPSINYKLNKRGTDILQNAKSPKQLRLEYARLVHGILLRVTGITFFNLPFKTIEISGFTQRLDQATGHIIDDYILDVCINREQFLMINFEQLDVINPIETLERFQLNRHMTVTGIFKSLYKMRPEQVGLGHAILKIEDCK